jgi:hypothetical protein
MEEPNDITILASDSPSSSFFASEGTLNVIVISGTSSKSLSHVRLSDPLEVFEGSSAFEQYTMSTGQTDLSYDKRRQLLERIEEIWNLQTSFINLRSSSRHHLVMGDIITEMVTSSDLDSPRLMKNIHAISRKQTVGLKKHEIAKKVFFCFVTTSTRTLDNQLFIGRLVSQLESLQSERKIDTALDVMYSKLEEKLLQGQFDLIDQLLQNKNVLELDENLLVGFLVITLPWSKQLNYRPLFYQHVMNRLQEKRALSEVNSIVEGLK